MIRSTASIVLALLLGGCATFIPIGSAKPAQQVAPPSNECNVRDFVYATELPKGAQHLGQVAVEPQASDEETYLELRRRICELGGDALSQPAWVKEPSEDHARLTANAWSLP
jgi:hypothetical protein